MSYVVLILFIFSIFLLCKNYTSRVTVFFVLMMTGLGLSIIAIIVYIAKFGQYPYPQNWLFIPDYHLYLSIHGIKIEYYTLMNFLNIVISAYVVMVPIFVYFSTKTKYRRKIDDWGIILLLLILPAFYVLFYNPYFGMRIYETFYGIQDISTAQKMIKGIFCIDIFNMIWMTLYLIVPIFKVFIFGIKSKLKIKRKQTLWIMVCLLMLNIFYICLFVFGTFRQGYVESYSDAALSMANANTFCDINIMGYNIKLLMGIRLLRSVNIPNYCYTVLPCIVAFMVLIMMVGMIKYQVIDSVDFFRQNILKRNIRGMNKNLRGVFHSFKNVIFTIDILLKNYDMEKDSQKKESAMNELKEYVEDSLTDISEMLNTLKNFEIKKEKHDAIKIVDSAISEAAIKENIEVDKVYVDEKMKIFVDKFYITKAIVNILHNASEAIELAKRENGKITVEVFSEYEWIVVRISDNGAGIEKKNVNNIFKEFYTTKSRMNNWGLGLYFVYKIVKKHLGHISVESKLGEKSSFQILLPRWFE